MRLPQSSIQATEWIDRSREIAFTFEGKRYTAHPGDTITSALWAHGKKMTGRSFKYHRPRGVLSLANHDINTVVQWGDKPNVRADVTPVCEGMELTAANTVGGLQADHGARISMFSRFMPVK